MGNTVGSCHRGFGVQISSLHWSHCRVWIFSLCAFPPTDPRSGLVVSKLAVGVAVSCGLSVLVLWWTVQLYRVYPTSHSWQLGCSPAPPGPRVGYCTSDPWFPFFSIHVFSQQCAYTEQHPCFSITSLDMHHYITHLSCLQLWDCVSASHLNNSSFLGS